MRCLCLCKRPNLCFSDNLKSIIVHRNISTVHVLSIKTKLFCVQHNFQENHFTYDTTELVGCSCRVYNIVHTICFIFYSESKGSMGTFYDYLLTSRLLSASSNFTTQPPQYCHYIIQLLTLNQCTIVVFF